MNKLVWKDFTHTHRLVFASLIWFCNDPKTLWSYLRLLNCLLGAFLLKQKHKAGICIKIKFSTIFVSRVHRLHRGAHLHRADGHDGAYRHAANRRGVTFRSGRLQTLEVRRITSSETSLWSEEFPNDYTPLSSRSELCERVTPCEWVHFNQGRKKLSLFPDPSQFSE